MGAKNDISHFLMITHNYHNTKTDNDNKRTQPATNNRSRNNRTTNQSRLQSARMRYLGEGIRRETEMCTRWEVR